MRKSWLKYAIGFIVNFSIRLIPFRPPNVEPIMATLMPFSKKYGYFGGFMFAFLSIALFDAFTSKLGMWTIITAVTYGAIGLASAWFFSTRKSGIRNYAAFAIAGTILYDAITMTTGPWLFGQTWAETIIGQIPFTALHLAGNIAFAIIMSPTLYSLVVDNKSLDTDVLIQKARNILAVRHT